MKVKYLIILLVFLYFFVAYNADFHGPDEPLYYAYTASIVEDGDLNLIDQIDRGYFDFTVSTAYNWPAHHSYGAVVLWAPFYGYAKTVYLLADRIGLKGMTAWDFDRVAKCVMSFSAIMAGLIIILLSYKLCRVFFSARNSFLSVAAISLGTPFFYYLVHDAGQANIPGALFALILIWFSTYMINMRRWHWFLYGAFFSLCVAVRIELWLLILIIAPLFILLSKSGRISWASSGYFFLGFLPIFILRAVNAYIKCGSFHMEEFHHLSIILNQYSPFNGIFSSYRGVFYTSPVLYICLIGILLLILNLSRSPDNTEARMKNIFFSILSAYLVMKLFIVKGAFGSGIDMPAARWLLPEFPIFVLLFAQVLDRARKPFMSLILILSFLSLLWNLLVISESMTGLDWIYVTGMPGINERVGVMKYLLRPIFSINDPDMKLRYCLLPALLLWGMIFYIASRFRFPQRPSFWYMKSGEKHSALRIFALFSAFLSLIYTSITLVNLFNNPRNAERLKAEGFFRDARIIEVPAMKASELEEDYDYLHLLELMRYYALKGDFGMMSETFNSMERYRRAGSYFDTEFLKPTAGLIEDHDDARRYEKAISCYAGIIRVHPASSEGYIGLGDIYMITGEYGKAIEALEEGAKAIPENSLIYRRLGKSYYFTGKFDKATKYFKETLRVNPRSVEAYLYLGYADKMRGEYSRSGEYFKEAIRLDPASVHARLNLGYIYYDKAEYAEAAGYFNEVIRIDPDNSDAYLYLGHINKSRCKYGKAEECYRIAIRLDPASVHARFHLGDLYNRINDSHNALNQAAALRSLKRDDLAEELERSVRR